ncbi:hypothetical protein WMY93_023507 [Mugilogobius chulae]|uniref:Uncharacterized protein n=1 Tax=Mugilogobius chulae TaxID=88201 RepID=A0AAW0NBG5_9GOBI
MASSDYGAYGMPIKTLCHSGQSLPAIPVPIKPRRQAWRVSRRWPPHLPAFLSNSPQSLSPRTPQTATSQSSLLHPVRPSRVLHTAVCGSALTRAAPGQDYGPLRTGTCSETQPKVCCRRSSRSRLLLGQNSRCSSLLSAATQGISIQTRIDINKPAPF